MNKVLSSLSIAMLASAVFAPVVPAHAAADEQIHGFVSQGYIKTTKENHYPVGNSGEGSYNFNDFGINFARRVAPRLRGGLQLFAQDRGYFGNDKITVDWAYGDYRHKDWLGVRVGLVLFSFGFFFVLW